MQNKQNCFVSDKFLYNLLFLSIKSSLTSLLDPLTTLLYTIFYSGLSTAV